MGIEPLQRSELAEHETLFRIVESVMGFVPNSMLIMGRDPNLLYSFSLLTSTVLKEKHKASTFTMLRMGIKHLSQIVKTQRRPKPGISAELRWLVAYVTSLSAGCQYCQGHTALSASRAGVSVEKIQTLDKFEESGLYAANERSAIRLALQSGASALPSGREMFIDLEQHFNEDEIIEIVSIISLFRFLNTWNSLMNTPLEDLPSRFFKENLSDS